MARRPTTTDPRTASLNAKWRTSGIKVRHNKVKVRTANDLGKNPNGAYTSNGSRTQAYDPEAKQFTKGTTSTKSGRLAVEGETNSKSAKTWTMTQKDDNGNVIRQSGRSQVVDRSKRYYDRRMGYWKMYQSENGAKMMQSMKQGGVSRSLGFTIG